MDLNAEIDKLREPLERLVAKVDVITQERKEQYSAQLKANKVKPLIAIDRSDAHETDTLNGVNLWSF